MEDFIKSLFLPSSLVALLLVSASGLLFLNRTRRVSHMLFVTATVLYLVLSAGPISHSLLGALEYVHPGLKDQPDDRVLDRLVILAGYARDDADIPLTGRVNGASALRLLEAVRLHRRNPQATIIVTGYGNVPVVMKNVLISVGIPDRRVIVDSQSRNTFESAVNLRATLGSNPFYLVTSAGHSPRAMRTFEKFAMKPIPAQTDYMTSKRLYDVGYYPSSRRLVMSDMALHEYLGMVWYYFLDRI